LLDVIVPCTKKQVPDLADKLGEGLIRNIIEMTDIPVRILVSVSGARRVELALVEAALESGKTKWAIVEASPTLRPMNSMVQEAVPSTRAKFVAICKPGTRINDPQWFGKMQVPFIKEPRCYVVGTDTTTQATAIHPSRQSGNKFDDLGPLALLKRSAIVDTKFSSVDGDDWIEEFAACAVKNGGTVWLAPGVRLSCTE
jgi:hypothetical protein